MLTAIRRTKSLSAWLTMIVAIVVVSVSSVLMMSGLSTSHVDPDTAAVTGVSTRGGLHSDTTVDVAAPSPVLATLNPVGSSSAVILKSAVSAASGVMPAVPLSSIASSSSAAPMTSQVGGGGAASDANAMVSLGAAAGANADASSTAASMSHPDKMATPLDASARKAAARNAARVAARHQAAVEAARINRSLRADIALYNAERRAALDHPQKLVPLQAASVPRTHSLWDEVPAPLSNLYRN